MYSNMVKIMESNAAGLVLRPALKTGFSEMGWGSTPLLSAKFFLAFVQRIGHHSSKVIMGVRFPHAGPVSFVGV